MMKRRLISCLLCLCMLIGLASMSLVAHAETYSGTCGDNVTWSFNTDTGKLTISGSGPMTNYYNSTAPWTSYRDSIISVEFGDLVTSIGNYALDN